jgi:hypothetical protein
MLDPYLDTECQFIREYSKPFRHDHLVLAELARTVNGGDNTYLEAVLNETLRYRPPVPITSRRALRKTELNGIQVPKRCRRRHGANVVLQPHDTEHSRAVCWTWRCKRSARQLGCLLTLVSIIDVQERPP